MSQEIYQAPTSAYAEPETELRSRSPLVAGLLSLVVPGAGQLYNGQYLLGVAFYLVIQATWILLQRGYLALNAWHYFSLFGFIIVLLLGGAVQAAWRGYRRSRITRRTFHRWALFLPVVIVLAALPALLPEMPSRTRPISNPFGSMRPTIREGEVVLVDYGHYREHPPRRGDLAVFLSPHDEKRLLKRVIGLPGEHVEMRHGRAVIDGEAGHDRWAHVEGPPLDLGFSAVVPAGHLFVLGDNRYNSRDSRAFGFVDESRLLGRAEAIYFSRDLERIGRPLTD